MQKKLIALCALLMLAAPMSFAAKFCGTISYPTDWKSGVFSIIDESGVTVATTGRIAAGNTDCTKDVPNGLYLIRFTGAIDNDPSSLHSMMHDDVIGCITTLYSFQDKNDVHVVFNNGLPPFNGNEFCTPVR